MLSPPDLRDLSGTERTGWPWSIPQAPQRQPAGGWPRISVVVPSYQQGGLLEETLRSVLLQAYPQLELLVIDGASTDGSVEILRRYEPWLTFWTSERDGGQSEAINRGLARATGEIVTFFGSDDVYEPGTFRSVARRFLANPGCGAVVGAFRFMDESSRRLEPVHPPRLPDPGPQDLTLLEPASWRLHQVSTFYARHALDDVGRRVREDLAYTMDRELLYRVAKRFPIVLDDRPYAAFRRHAGSKSVSSILAMSREMGELHLMAAAPGEDRPTGRRRRRLARHHRARGHLKLARSEIGRGRAAAALLGALRHRADLLWHRSYLVHWLEVLGLANSARRILRALRSKGGSS